MTESEWNGCVDPAFMYDLLRRTVTERKLRLIACACCRRVQHLVRGFSTAIILDLAERMADGQAGEEEVAEIRNHNWAYTREPCSPHHSSNPSLAVRDLAARAVAFAAEEHDACFRAVFFASDAMASLARSAVNPEEDAGYVAAQQAERRVQCDLIRDICGYPCRRSTIPDSVLAWNDGTVVKLAQAIYEERTVPSCRFDDGRLAILADAMEDAGCQDANVLGHLREPLPHMLGCHVLDALLGKE